MAQPATSVTPPRPRPLRPKRRSGNAYLGHWSLTELIGVGLVVRVRLLVERWPHGLAQVTEMTSPGRYLYTSPVWLAGEPMPADRSDD
jgi:hypothetical protein